MSRRVPKRNCRCVISHDCFWESRCGSVVPLDSEANRTNLDMALESATACKDGSWSKSMGMVKHFCCDSLPVYLRQYSNGG
jgi:hypothetical protein